MVIAIAQAITLEVVIAIAQAITHTIMEVNRSVAIFGSMFKNGSGRTADLLYAEVLPCSYTRFSDEEEG